jgi:hypothetical protein
MANDYEILFVIFPPGIGGNHLVNLLASSNIVANRNLSSRADDYNNYLLEFYSDKNNIIFHVDDLPTKFANQPEEINELIKKKLKNDESILVLPMHIDMAYFLIPILKPYGKIKFITFEIFEIPYDFFKRTGRTKVISNIHLHQFLYRKDVVQKLLDISNNDGIAIQSFDFMKDDITDILENLNSFFNLNLDMNFCLTLHKLRQNRICK